MLAMFDLRMELTEGSFLEQSALESTLSDIEGIETVETRLLISTLIDASKDGETILYPGRLIGQDVADGGPHINKLNVTEGNGLAEAGFWLEPGRHRPPVYQLPRALAR